MQYNLSVKSSNFEYLISNDTSSLNSLNGRKIVVYDGKVESAARRLFPENHDFIALDIGETTKTIQSVTVILLQLAKLNVVKEDFVIAIGGGALQDLVTLSASIYMRGIRWVYVPTTLMSMLDSCIGGKSSINLGEYKNLVGNFYPPKNIYIDPIFLETLSQVDIACGLAEGVKICFAASDQDANRFKLLVRNWRESQKSEAIEEAIFLSLEKKKWFVEVDEFDKKERKLLNFGHSFGHALEAATDFMVPHGIGVLIGMASAVNYSISSERTLKLKEWVHEELQLVKLNIPTMKIFQDKFLNALQRDKKNTSTQLCLIVPDNLGTLHSKFMELSQQTLRDCFQILVKTMDELELSYEIL